MVFKNENQEIKPNSIYYIVFIIGKEPETEIDEDDRNRKAKQKKTISIFDGQQHTLGTIQRLYYTKVNCLLTPWKNG